HLNENPAFQRQNPSAENVAALIAERLGDEPGATLWCIEVEEAPGCTARFLPHR
ncbi:MAG: 6-carboxytetrahydropterin synthase, partial [Planctomycetes bacterium]|nr:6-carboxytetrahydropterin synthase [Planctomycetota bacterium]